MNQEEYPPPHPSHHPVSPEVQTRFRGSVSVPKVACISEKRYPSQVCPNCPNKNEVNLKCLNKMGGRGYKDLIRLVFVLPCCFDLNPQFSIRAECSRPTTTEGLSCVNFYGVLIAKRVTIALVVQKIRLARFISIIPEQITVFLAF